MCGVPARLGAGTSAGEQEALCVQGADRGAAFDLCRQVTSALPHPQAHSLPAFISQRSLRTNEEALGPKRVAPQPGSHTVFSLDSD